MSNEIFMSNNNGSVSIYDGTKHVSTGNTPQHSALFNNVLRDAEKHGYKVSENSSGSKRSVVLTK